MGKLDGQVALITGASRGIGEAIAVALAREGASVALTARSAEPLEHVADEAREAGAVALAHPADVTDERQVASLFDAVAAQFDRLDLLVNNAGAFDGGPVDQLETEAWDRVIATNLTAPFFCSRAAMRVMKPQGHGRIVNIGSISAQRVRPESAAYSASKFGIWGLTQVIALEGRDHGITCGCVHPGNTMVPRRQSSGLDEDAEPMMGAAQVAELVVSMAALPRDVNLLEAILMPRDQEYLGRG